MNGFLRNRADAESTGYRHAPAQYMYRAPDIACVWCITGGVNVFGAPDVYIDWWCQRAEAPTVAEAHPAPAAAS